MPARRWITRLHSLTGIVPLLGFLVLHTWETASATGGRERFMLRVLGARGGLLAVALEVVLILVPLVLHAGLGVCRARHDGHGRRYVDRSSRWIQWLTGVLVLGFISVHLAHTWMAKLGGLGPFGLYEALRTDLPRPAYLGVYVVGLTALSLHLAQGIGAFAVTWGLAPTERRRRAWRWGGGLLAVALWVASLNTTAHFATGRAPLFQVEPLLPEAAAGP
ncbi:MAG: hypothetical protein ACODAU_08765 [Myxococcota bacterium]